MNATQHERHIIYFCLLPIHQNPPCLTQCCQLRDMGIPVTLVTTGCDEITAGILKEKGVVLELIPSTINKYHKLNERIHNFYVYKKCWHKIRHTYWKPDTVLWFGSEPSWMHENHNAKGLHPNIVSCLEFYEKDSWQNGMKEHLSDIDILTACEPHRAGYMKDWWHLDKLPYVLRNKPYYHPRTKNMPGSTEQTRKAISMLEGRKVLLYQGAIVADRDLGILAASLHAIHSDYTLVLSGPVTEGDTDQVIGQLKEKYEDTIYLGNIPSPKHLEITSHADICIAFYKDNSINNRYCAPNKIYEYTGFGIPVLANNIPGLTSTIGEYGAGLCIDFSDAAQVADALDTIQKGYEKFCANAARMFDETDNTGTIRQILDDAFSRIRT